MKLLEDYTEEDHKAIRELEMASSALRKAVGGKIGEQTEKRYGQAYALCYKLGLKQYPPTVCRCSR